MAPEQAEGRLKDVGPHTDVYALGAVLYECLTGRPPFVGASVLETLEQVRTREPVPPSRLRPQVPRDLETICLKCLHKEPARRYASALELAEDLGRYLCGEPVRARPVGRLERAGRWCRRKPAAAALVGVSALAALVLVGVIGTSAGIVYRNNQELARTNQDLEGQRNQARLEEGKANEARDRAEATLARSLLRPLGHGTGPVNAIELDALWELAESPSDRVRLLFIEQAFPRAGTARQLRNRAELALHAAVGLDRQRRERVEAILLRHLRDDAASLSLREEVALAAAQANSSPELVAAAARLLSEALDKETDFRARQSLAQGLSAVAARLSPEEAATAATATRLLSEALAQETDYFRTRSVLAQALVAVAARLSPEEAATAIRFLTEALAKEINPYTRKSLAQALSAVAVLLGPEEATRLLSEALAQETDSNARQSLAEGLVAVSVRLGPEEAVQRSLLAARAVAGTAPLPPLAGLAVLIQAAQPLPSHLSTQELVDHLKMPTCVGPAREPFLKLLGERYHRAFADQWEVVEYAEKHLPDLDLKSPPKRPGK
jgi:hypothetical protein